MVPLSINCWPSVSGGESYVNIEYEATADFDLQNVVISIPLPALSQAPRVPQARSLTHVMRHANTVWVGSYKAPVVPHAYSPLYQTGSDANQRHHNTRKSE